MTSFQPDPNQPNQEPHVDLGDGKLANLGNDIAVDKTIHRYIAEYSRGHREIAKKVLEEAVAEAAQTAIVDPVNAINVFLIAANASLLENDSAKTTALLKKATDLQAEYEVNEKIIDFRVSMLTARQEDKIHDAGRVFQELIANLDEIKKWGSEQAFLNELDLIYITDELFELGLQYYDWGDHAQTAVAWFTVAQEFAEKRLGEDHIVTNRIRVDFAHMAYVLGEPESATKLYKETIDSLVRTNETVTDIGAFAYAGYAKASWASEICPITLNQIGAAFKKARDLVHKAEGKSPQRYLNIIHSSADFAYERGRYAQVEKIILQGYRMAEEGGVGEALERDNDLRQKLAISQMQLGKFGDAAVNLRIIYNDLDNTPEIYSSLAETTLDMLHDCCCNLDLELEAHETAKALTEVVDVLHPGKTDLASKARAYIGRTYAAFNAGMYMDFIEYVPKTLQVLKMARSRNFIIENNLYMSMYSVAQDVGDFRATKECFVRHTNMIKEAEEQAGIKLSVAHGLLFFAHAYLKIETATADTRKRYVREALKLANLAEGSLQNQFEAAQAVGPDSEISQNARIYQGSIEAIYATALLYSKAYAKAEAGIRKAMDLIDPKHAGGEHVATLRSTLGKIFFMQGRYEESIVEFTEAKDVFELNNKSGVRLITCLEGIARASDKLGYYNRAEEARGRISYMRDYISSLPRLKVV